MNQLTYELVTTVLAGSMFCFCKIIPGREIVQLVVRVVLSVVVSAIAYIILFRKTNRYAYAQTKLYQILSRNI